MGAGGSALAAFLLGRLTLPDPKQVRTAMLGAFAYTALPADHPARPRFRADYLNGLARHLSIKAEVAPLLAAWHAAGIEALLWKGFYLAEFVYPIPGTRFHGDVDVLLHPRDLRRAARIAAELGWTGGRDPPGRPNAFRHYAYGLIRPGGATLLDIHRYVLHRPAPWTIRPKHVTEALWNGSIETDWEGATVWLPHPVDAALICLILHRAWGSDRWSFKPHDFLDFRYLIEREGVDRTALESRAHELRCGRTLALTLDRCDPWAGRFEPGSPSPARAWRFDILTLSEHAPHGCQQWFGRALRAPSLIRDTLRALPLVVRVRRAARHQPDLHRLMATLTPAIPPRRSAARRRRRLVEGIRWATWIVRDPRIGRCVIRSLAIYRALRQQGWQVEFVSGIRRDANGLIGHAWVELDGQVLPELRQWRNRMLYRVNFRYPRIHRCQRPAASGNDDMPPRRPGR